MKSITMNVVNLENGTQRATSRISGRTVKFVDSPVITKDQCFDVLRAAAGGHEISKNVFSLQYIDINDTAKAIMGI